MTAREAQTRKDGNAFYKLYEFMVGFELISVLSGSV